MIKIVVGDSIDIVIKTSKMDGSLQGFSDFHGDKVTNMLDEYFKSMKITEEPPEKEMPDKEVEEFANALDKMILEGEERNLSEEFILRLFKAIHQESINHQQAIFKS